jgi:RecA-family ATPase
MLSLPEIAAATGGEVCGSCVKCPAPGHSDRDRSLSIRLAPDQVDGFVVYNHSDGDHMAGKRWVMERLGIKSRFNGAKATAKPADIFYLYEDETGAPHLRVKRTPAKQFIQYHLEKRKWVKGHPKGPKIPFHLPQLLAAEHENVVVVEGERDVITMEQCGFVATTAPMGAGKWWSELDRYFVGRDVIIMGDNDPPGEHHVALVESMLKPVARSVKIVKVPAPHKDVSDWVNIGGATADDIGKLIEATPSEKPPETLRWLNMTGWDHEPIPERKWAIRDRVPLRQAGLFSGEGGTGKSIIELMKDVAHVAGKDWFGSLPEIGPAIYIGCEDDAEELHIRLAAIIRHYDMSFDEVVRGGLRVLPMLGKDATLCAATKGGKVETTVLYRQLLQEAGDVKPKNISVDTLTGAFAGSEIDRVQVHAFCRHMQALAIAANGSVTVLSHPSLQGITTGTGISGSTAWHNAFRFRQFLKGVKADNGELPDDDLRELQFLKNQYGPRGENMVLRYARGVFVKEAGIGDLDKLARAAKAQDVFMELLRRLSGEGRTVSNNSKSNNYAPTVFAQEDEAKKHRLRKPELEEAMRQLFKAGKIRNEQYGRPSRPCFRIGIGAA